MKTIILIFIFCLTTLYAGESKPKYTIDSVPKKMSVKTKKERFYYLLVPEITKVYADLDRQYKKVLQEFSDANRTKESAMVSALKKEYDVKTDDLLLEALKPHPKSIALAQAAIESAWATSRFAREANNIFGMWNNNKDANRIAASQQREGEKTIYLSKYDSIEASVRAYYKTLAKGKTYKEFRKVKMQSNDVFEMVKKLDKYSERGKAYADELASMIRYNKLTKYD